MTEFIDKDFESIKQFTIKREKMFYAFLAIERESK